MEKGKKLMFQWLIEWKYLSQESSPLAIYSLMSNNNNVIAPHSCGIFDYWSPKRELGSSMPKLASS